MFLNIFLIIKKLFFIAKIKLEIPNINMTVPIILFIGKKKLMTTAKKLKKIIPNNGISNKLFFDIFSLKKKKKM